MSPGHSLTDPANVQIVKGPPGHETALPPALLSRLHPNRGLVAEKIPSELYCELFGGYAFRINGAIPVVVGVKALVRLWQTGINFAIHSQCDGLRREQFLSITHG